MEAMPNRPRSGVRSEEVPQEAKAPCVGATDLFYGPEADLRVEPEAQRKRREAKAKLTCAGCFMRLECLSFALANEEITGVWGGMSPGERREFLKKVKSHRKSNWKEALLDFDYLRYKAEAFLDQEAKRQAKRNRKKQPAGVPRSGAAVVAISTGRRKSSRSRPVPRVDRSGDARPGWPTGARTQADPDNQLGAARRKAASPGRPSTRRDV